MAWHLHHLFNSIFCRRRGSDYRAQTILIELIFKLNERARALRLRAISMENVHGGANKNEVGTSSSFKWCGKRFVHWNGWKTHTKMVRMNDFIKPWSNSYWNTTFALPFFMFRARNCQTTTNYCQLCPPSDRNIDLPSSNWCGQKFKSFYFRNESNVFFLTRLMLFLSSISTTFAFWC